MTFEETEIHGAFIVRLDEVTDDRGFHARVWCREELEAKGLDTDLSQCNISFNDRRGTLRGLHYQVEPFAETKLVRCTAGAIFDVIADLREDSATYGRWTARELSADNRLTIYVPKGVAHGFLTLSDRTEVFYQQSARYSPVHARGIRWDDPFLAIEWPEEVRVMSERDRSLPGFPGKGES